MATTPSSVSLLPAVATPLMVALVPTPSLVLAAKILSPVVLAKTQSLRVLAAQQFSVVPMPTKSRFLVAMTPFSGARVTTQSPLPLEI
jgi:hypothetical protein